MGYGNIRGRLDRLLRRRAAGDDDAIENIDWGGAVGRPWYPQLRPGGPPLVVRRGTVRIKVVPFDWKDLVGRPPEEEDPIEARIRQLLEEGDARPPEPPDQPAGEEAVPHSPVPDPPEEA